MSRADTVKNIREKYIVTKKPDDSDDLRPKRGVQAEINKLHAIRRSIQAHSISQEELRRLSTELNFLKAFVDNHL
jgi:hypothetical protein